MRESSSTSSIRSYLYDLGLNEAWLPTDCTDSKLVNCRTHERNFSYRTRERLKACHCKTSCYHPFLIILQGLPRWNSVDERNKGRVMIAVHGVPMRSFASSRLFTQTPIFFYKKNLLFLTTVPYLWFSQLANLCWKTHPFLLSFSPLLPSFCLFDTKPFTLAL